MREILIFGSKANTSIENKYLFAFKKLKKKIKIYDTDSYIPKIFKIKFINKIFLYPRILVNSFLLFTICISLKNRIILIFKGQFFLSYVINYLKKRKKHYFVNINGDDPFNFSIIDISTKNLINSLPSYDLIFIWSKRILKKLKNLTISGKIKYLPFAYDVMIEKISKNNKREKIIFYGSWDLERENFLNKIKNKDLYIFGSGWEKSSSNFYHHNRLFTKEINRKDILKNISASYAVINIFRKQNIASHNMKSFEIPAYGGIQFSEYSKELEIFFRKNKSIFFYNSAYELNKKLRIFKKKKKLNKYINYSLKDVNIHSYKNRAKKILEYVDKNKKK